MIILLRTILHALTTKDALVDEEFSAAILSVEDDEGEKDELPNSGISSNPDEFPTLAQSMAKWSTVESNKSKNIFAISSHT